MTSWKRPDSVPHPKVWRRAVGRKPVDGKVPSFVIQDVPEDREEELVQFMVENFVRNEPLSRCLNSSNDPVSIKELREQWVEVVAQKITIAAFLKEDGPRPRLVGCNLIGVVTRADKNIKNEFKGETASKIMKLLDYLDSLADPFEKYGVEEYIAAMGLSVAKEFQGQGLGKELLKARFDVGRAVGVKLTVTAFTAIESQVLATREGFEELARIDYKDYKVDGKEVFPGITSKCAILMAKRI
ncbi:uncharacterized protein LOC134543028 isoform X2 [Bacillus rossius redtenbacheri]|uniref:uncharacterized protein LOC134543028 isoform X2 n=1 Tax=Bacillus rossius redtenbacheri TaxID=93214 RepID=UPI002FDEEF7A